MPSVDLRRPGATTSERGEGGDLLFVDRARDGIAFYRDRDLLRDGLADAGGFVYGRVRLGRSAAKPKNPRLNVSHRSLPLSACFSKQASSSSHI